MPALVKTVLLAVAALLAAAAACALCVHVYPAFGFPLFALASAELIWLIVVGLAVPVAIIDRERDWRALLIVPLSLLLVYVYDDFILALASARGLALDDFTNGIIGLPGGAIGYAGLDVAGPTRPAAGASMVDAALTWFAASPWKAALGLAGGVLTGLLLRSR